MGSEDVLWSCVSAQGGWRERRYVDGWRSVDGEDDR